MSLNDKLTKLLERSKEHNFNNYYKEVKEIGRGAQGVVMEVKRKFDQKVFCSKIINVNYQNNGELLVLLRELITLKLQSSKLLLSAKDIFIEPTEDNFLKVSIITKKFDSDLKNIIYSNQSLEISQIQYIAFQLALALENLHSKSLVHRDVKPGNVLISSDCLICLCDFGLCRYFDSTLMIGNDKGVTSGVTTRWYRAPEILFGSKTYNSKVDVWSYGCILAEMVLRRPFLKGSNDEEQIELILETFGKPPGSFISQSREDIQDKIERNYDDINIAGDIDSR